ncbi:MAG TPA: dipeptide/oligopeptide/nickel ABC transporter permease/ATP-binding protein [Candidatus Nitrosotalea sp.]|nr:dipeptide/oligopeptide/nickel ABC transporter permease/ATP-binding protein [Candidatus Nitrosotalea sp.]
MLKALLRSPTGPISLIALALILVVAVIGPIFWTGRATTLNFAESALTPGPGHLLGTDDLGRDIFARILVATRSSLVLSLAATLIGAGIGIPLGAAAALMTQRLRSVALRAIDALIVFPGILIAIVIGAIIGRGAFGAALGVGIAGSFAFARVASTLTLGVGGRDYVAAARVLGISRRRILVKYVLTNIADTLAIAATVSISSNIIQVSALSFLGLGVQAPQYDWGGLLTQGVKSFYFNPAAALGPVVAIALTSLTFGLFGEALARAFNPLLWARQGGDGAKRMVSEKTSPSPDSSGSHPASGINKGGSANAVLDVSELTVTFPGQRRVVNDVSFKVEKGEILGIVGESGSGKTMTAMALASLVPYPGKVDGVIRLQGTDMNHVPLRDIDRLLGTKIALIFQDPLASLNPALRIGIQLTEGAETHLNLKHAEALGLAVDRLREVNLPSAERLLNRYPHELSGGMRQRVMIAMGLMSERALLIADEPTTALDVTTQAQIIELLARVNEVHGTAIILITHNLGLVTQICDRVLVMYAGRIVEELSTQQLIDRPLHPYTLALRAAIPDMTQSVAEPLETIPGQAPSPEAIPPGCPYHPRCPLAVDRCRSEVPPLLAREDGRRVACWVANQDLQ